MGPQESTVQYKPDKADFFHTKWSLYERAVCVSSNIMRRYEFVQLSAIASWKKNRKKNVSKSNTSTAWILSRVQFR